DLLERSPIRPVTPVGELLFDEQRRATENAIFHKMSAQAALDESTKIVQRALDRSLSPPRGPMVPWKYFLWFYAVVIIGASVLVYWWDTRRSDSLGRTGYFRSQWWGGWISAAPWIIGFLLFTGGSLLFSIVVSFCD